MRVSNWIVAVVLAATVSGCTNWQGLMDEQSAKYLGKPVDQMYGEWGAPRRSAPLSGGGNFYEFVAYKTYRCEMSAWTDSTGIVTELQLGGQNGCAIGY